MIKRYTFDTRKELVDFIEEYKTLIVGQKINNLYAAYGWINSHNDYPILLELDDYCIGVNYMYLSDMDIHVLPKGYFNLFDDPTFETDVVDADIYAVLDGDTAKDFYCYGAQISGISIDSFSDEHYRDSVSAEPRPEGGDYFSTIRIHLDNNCDLCICGEPADMDGYMDVWLEDYDSDRAAKERHRLREEEDLRIAESKNASNKSKAVKPHYDIIITKNREPYFKEEMSFSKHPKVEGSVYLKMEYRTFMYFDKMIAKYCPDFQIGCYEQDVVVERTLWRDIYAEIKRYRDMILHSNYNDELMRYLNHANVFLFADEKDIRTYWDFDDDGRIVGARTTLFIESRKHEMTKMFDVFLNWIKGQLNDGVSGIRLVGTYNWERLEREKILAAGKDQAYLDELSDELMSIEYTKEELMELAITAAKEYEFTYEWDECCQNVLEKYGKRETDSQGWYIKLYKEYDSDYVEKIKSHFLIKTLNVLFENGFNPNTCLDTEERNIMLELKNVDKPFLAATAMRILLEHGADPYIEDEDGEGLFYNIDGDIAMDIGLLPDRFVQFIFQCWLVLIGYGARPKETEPFHLNPGHSYDELKEFEYYDWKIRYEPDAGENILHIIDIRTGEEIGYL